MNKYSKRFALRRALKDRSLSCAEICVELDIKPSFAWQLINRLRDQNVIDENGQGKFFLVAGTAGSSIHKWDLKTRSIKAKRIADNMDKILMMVDEGNTLKRIAELYDVSEPTLTKYLKQDAPNV